MIEFRWVLTQGPPSRELVFDTLGRMVGLNEPKLDPKKIWMSEDERNLEEEKLERKRIKEKEEMEGLEKGLEADEQKGHLKTGEKFVGAEYGVKEETSEAGLASEGQGN